MNKTKQKLNSLFDLSIIVEKLKILEEQQFTLYNLNKRPNYELQKQSNTQQIIPRLIDDFEIKRKFKEIQNDSFMSWKPIILKTTQNKSQVRPQQTSQIQSSPKPLEMPKTQKNNQNYNKFYLNKRIRTKSIDQRVQLRKIETKDIEAQFNETKILINRFNRIKRKAVRFNVLT